MAPVPETLLTLFSRSLLPSATASINDDPRSLSPIAVHDVHIQKRATTSVNPGSGSQPANEFNNKGFQALFALLGMGMVLGSLWFFFWAKNGGFKWRQGDWEDYKSTVLRRKGPDGKTLSNATKSTKLGGGSVVHGGSYGRNDIESSVGYTDETGTSADMSEMREKDNGHGFGLRGGEAKKKHRKERNNKHDPDLREYREERAARVGGLNRQADGVYVDYSATEPSVVGSDLSQQPLTGPKKEKDKKKIDKEKKKRAIERMKEAQRKEKEAKKTAAAEAKAAKEAEKVNKAKAKKEEKAKGKKQPAPVSEPSPTEVPSEPVPAPPKASRRAPPSGAYSFTTGDDTATVYTGMYTQTGTAPSEMNETYYSDYRPHAEPSAFNNATRSHNSTPNRRDRERRSESHSRHSSPRKHHRSSRPAQSDIFSNGDTEETGTKIYPCHIPGLSAAPIGPGESVSQVGVPTNGRRGRDVMSGYRRGGGRRDSLSDSDS